MFDIGWTEMLVIAVVMIVVVGPKDLPKMLRTFGRTTAKMRAMAGDFQKQFNEALKEAELDDVKKSVDALKGLNPAAEIRKQLNPFEKAAADVRAGVDAAMKPKPAAAATPVAVAAEPLKTGATLMPAAKPAPAIPVSTEPGGMAASDKPVQAPAASVVAAKPVKPASPATAKAPAAKAEPKPKANTASAKPVAAKAAPSKAVKKKPAGSAP
jgi:sec-independent protein translocase protein TatB